MYQCGHWERRNLDCVFVSCPSILVIFLNLKIYFKGSKRTYSLLQTMINFIKYSDEKIHEVDAKMKAVRNMKDTIDRLKKQKDIIVNTINKKSLDRVQRGAELKTVSIFNTFLMIYFVFLVVILFFRSLKK